MTKLSSIVGTRGAFAAAVVLTSSGCATKSDLRDLRTEIHALAVRQDSLMVEIRAQNLSTQDTLREQTGQLVDFRGDISQQLREIDRRLTRIEALAGENQRVMSAVRDELANTRRPGTRPATGSGAAADPEAVVPGTGVEGAEALYRTATGLFERGSLTTARQAFQQFLQANPGHALAPSAHFYLADILVQEDRLDDALLAFQDIQRFFPNAEKVPDALFRIALIQIQQEKLEDAKVTLERIVNTYPGTGVALLAEEKLAEIR
ncbi:MAG: tetratricopeptide repeat protein [Gemmatimonadota bacterium]|nr:tetratricopeptide repeat protein [Gemmatimonadota bacterium]MDH5759779.1 tetratricopeptide repeat protein [Gemmatimonadota bacterium]